MLCQILHEGSMGWNINFPPCITLQGKEERSHPHEGARQCTTSPSGVLQKSSFQFQLRPLRSTLWERLQGKHQTTHLLQVLSHTFSPTSPASWGVHQNCYRSGKSQDHRSNCHCPPDFLKIFSHFFSFFRHVSHRHVICILTVWCTEWLLTKGYIPAAFQTTTLSHSDPHVYLSMHFFYSLPLNSHVSCHLSTSSLFSDHPHCSQVLCLLTL